MYVCGIPPIKIHFLPSPKKKDFRKNICYVGRLLLKELEKYEMFGNRELLVINKNDVIIGCVNASQLIGLYPDKKETLYLERTHLARIKTVIPHENTIYLKQITTPAGNHRSLFVIKEEVKRKRFQNYNFNDVDSEITVRSVLRMIGNQEINYPHLKRYTVKI